MIQENGQVTLMAQTRSNKEPRLVLVSTSRKWSARASIWQPPTDMYETEDTIVVQVEVAGMRDAEFIITIEGRNLAIGGIRPGPAGMGAYHQMEIPFGEFLTMVELPSPVEADEIEAEYSDGFLRMVFHKQLSSNIEVKT